MFWNLGAQKVDGIGLKCLDHFSLFVQGNGWRDVLLVLIDFTPVNLEEPVCKWALLANLGANPHNFN
jgi:hypothetical protein